MRNHADANCTVRREQVAVDGAFVFFQKSKLKAVHAFVQKPDEDAEYTVKLAINGEDIGEIKIGTAGVNQVVSSALLDVIVPQGSVVEVGGAKAGSAVLVAEYEVLPDADETTTMVPVIQGPGPRAALPARHQNDNAA